MPGDDKQVAIRKRQQIENASRTMFMWVAIAAALVGTAGVMGVSLFERLAFNQEVINETSKTAATLKSNNEVVEELKNNVRLLNTNSDLGATPRTPGTEPISVVLDALPAQANSEAFGTSLQKKLLREDGVSIDALAPLSLTSEVSDETTAGDGAQPIAFQFTVSTSAKRASALKEVLRNLERSIRPINVINIKIEQQSDRISMSGVAETYYLPETLVQLDKIEVPKK